MKVYFKVRETCQPEDSEPPSFEQALLVGSKKGRGQRPSSASIQAFIILFLILASFAGVTYLLYMVNWNSAKNLIESNENSNRQEKSGLNMKVTFKQDKESIMMDESSDKIKQEDEDQAVVELLPSNTIQKNDDLTDTVLVEDHQKSKALYENSSILGNFGPVGKILHFIGNFLKSGKFE